MAAVTPADLLRWLAKWKRKRKNNAFFDDNHFFLRTNFQQEANLSSFINSHLLFLVTPIGKKAKKRNEKKVVVYQHRNEHPTLLEQINPLKFIPHFPQIVLFILLLFFCQNWETILLFLVFFLISLLKSTQSFFFCFCFCLWFHLLSFCTFNRQSKNKTREGAKRKEESGWCF